MMKNNDGLPEIAESFRNKQILIWIAIGIMLTIFVAVFCYSKRDVKQLKPIEDVYEPNVQSGIAVKKEEPVASSSLPHEAQQQATPEMLQAQALLLQEKQKELQQRLAAPLMVVTNNLPAKEADAKLNNSSRDPNTQFFNQVSAQNAESSMATVLGNLSFLITQGSFIHAVLEPASNSDLPGFLRAIVSEPNYSADGSQVLIPAGSRLLGQYKSGVQAGQSRIYIVWTRLITPAGVSINLGSSGVDNLGVAGVEADEINRHFWQRFGTSSLLSMLGMGAANVGVSSADQPNSAAAYRAALASSFAQSAENTYQQDNKVGTTLKSYQGKPIIVFVARDLNFQNVMKQIKPTVNVF